nr:immunoglobulin heavy chain junction region [Macaca mulatta]MOX95577.1 immunoglobulin heavy chain junction region [Macaca mulatta]
CARDTMGSGFDYW